MSVTALLPAEKGLKERCRLRAGLFEDFGKFLPV
jgi:hypothetical protein